jgi:hypothetical protein
MSMNTNGIKTLFAASVSNNASLPQAKISSSSGGLLLQAGKYQHNARGASTNYLLLLVKWQ